MSEIRWAACVRADSGWHPQGSDAENNRGSVQTRLLHLRNLCYVSTLFSTLIEPGLSYKLVQTFSKLGFSNLTDRYSFRPLGSSWFFTQNILRKQWWYFSKSLITSINPGWKKMTPLGIRRHWVEIFYDGQEMKGRKKVLHSSSCFPIRKIQIGNRTRERRKETPLCVCTFCAWASPANRGVVLPRSLVRGAMCSHSRLETSQAQEGASFSLSGAQPALDSETQGSGELEDSDHGLI